MHTRPPFPSGWSSIRIDPSNLTLANTLPVGQSFLWHRIPLPPPRPAALASSSSTSARPLEEFSRAVDHPPRVVCLRQTPTEIFYTAVHPSAEGQDQDEREGTTRRWLEDYFHLGRYPDLGELYAEWRERDPGLFGKTEVDGRAVGVRVLRQDPWECLVAFITSTNNHIPRIASLMHKLGQHFSPPLLTLEDPSMSSDSPEPSNMRASTPPISTTYHLFPRPPMLPSSLETTLRELGFGYRAGFIESALATLREEFGDAPGAIEAGLAAWRGKEVDYVRERLLRLKGVGRKVADCVMLMCLDQPSLIPIDTHLMAIAARHPSFPPRLRNKPMSKVVYEEVQAFLLEKWGLMGGWCQAVMFAADLPAATTARTPRALVKMEVKEEVQAIKMQIGLEVEVASPPSSVSTVLATPADEKPMWIGVEAESPLKGKGEFSSHGKRKAKSVVADLQYGDSEVVKEERVEVTALPAGYGFKRTRSAARIELVRSSSGVSAVAREVAELDV